MKAAKRFGLARVISKLGYCSRSRAAALIGEKRVMLNGRVAHDPETPACVPPDRIEIDGAAIKKSPSVYLMMNKPRGVVTTASDEKGRATVYDSLKGDFLDGEEPWVAPVGRLDKASEGLLLLTNDSEWAARISDPGSHLDKTYHVQVDYIASPELLSRIERGCLVDEESLRAKRVRRLRGGDKNSWLEIVLDEGKNRQIRRMLEALEVGVLRLVRVSIGPLRLGDLPKGGVRALNAQEKRGIDLALRRSSLT